MTNSEIERMAEVEAQIQADQSLVADVENESPEDWRPNIDIFDIANAKPPKKYRIFGGKTRPKKGFIVECESDKATIKKSIAVGYQRELWKIAGYDHNLLPEYPQGTDYQAAQLGRALALLDYYKLNGLQGNKYALQHKYTGRTVLAAAKKAVNGTIVPRVYIRRENGTLFSHPINKTKPLAWKKYHFLAKVLQDVQIVLVPAS